jgi:hypothetical protein
MLSIWPLSWLKIKEDDGNPRSAVSELLGADSTWQCGAWCDVA